jgi:branched-chain amino acid transport system ATP-binding protein
MILETKGISKSFGNLQALLDVDLVVDEGQIFGIAGPNGAGKSTLFNVIAGVYPPTSGKVLFKKQDVTKLGPHRICHLGLARTFQVPKTFSSLSVYDNLRVGATFGLRKKNKKKIHDTIDATLEFLGIASSKDMPAANLDLYTTKLVGLAMTLATDCRLLMLDEPLAGLSPPELYEYLDVVRNLNQERGVTVLFIEHILDALIEISDKMLVLDNGQVIYTGEPEKACEDPTVIECYLGEAKEAI